MRFFCSREKNVHVVYPKFDTNQPNQPQEDSEAMIYAVLEKDIDKAFQSIQTEKAIDTLVLFYSGHHSDNGFRLLGNDQYVLSDDNLCSKIKKLHNVEKVIAFLDCCHVKPLADWHLGQFKVVRFSGSISGCETFDNKFLGNSLFTKVLKQAFTRKANDERCLNVGKTEEKECGNCKELDTDIITFEKLAKYLEKHMKVFGEDNQRLVSPSFDAINGPDWVIGFKLPCNAKLKFNVKKNGGMQDESVSMKDYKMDLKELKRHFLRMLFESKY